MCVCEFVCNLMYLIEAFVFICFYGFRGHVFHSPAAHISLDTGVFVFNPIGYPKINKF